MLRRSQSFFNTVLIVGLLLLPLEVRYSFIYLLNTSFNTYIINNSFAIFIIYSAGFVEYVSSATVDVCGALGTSSTHSRHLLGGSSTGCEGRLMID